MPEGLEPYFFCVVIPLERENKRSGRSAAADTPFGTIPRSGDWTTRSQGKLAQFHVISEEIKRMLDVGSRSVPAHANFSRRTRTGDGGVWRGRGVKKKIKEKMMENSTERTMPARFILASAQHPVVTRPKSARAHWLTRVPARKHTDRTTSPRLRAAKRSP